MEITSDKVDICEAILREICYSNGLQYNKLTQEGLSCLSLEMYFTGFPQFTGLDNFPNLQHLCVVGQPLERIENFIFLNKLVELWIVECNIQEIQGLENCEKIRKLYLYSNKISKIENLNNMTCLKVLHLNNNQIRTVQGLETLWNLRELNLAENLIEFVGPSMKNLLNLETLELSGNLLFCLQDLRNLSHLKNLTCLSLKSCLYKACPVANLLNYSFYVVYHFPQLKQLDDENISSAAIKATAELVVERKMRFYRMKKQLIQSEMYEAYQKIEQGYLEKIKPMLKLVHQLDLNLLLKTSSSETFKSTAVKEISRCYRKMDRYADEKTSIMNECTIRAQTQLGYLQVELESAGNITYTTGNPSYPWFYPCLKLVQSRFCGSDCLNESRNGIFVTQIVHIENMMTLARFNFHVTSAQEKDSYLPMNKNNTVNKNMDYLFHVWKNGSDGELLDILRNGMDGQVCHMSNSIYIANAGILSSRKGRLILCRVFLGKSLPYEGFARPNICGFINADSLYQPLQSYNEKSMELIKSTSLSSPLLISLCSCADKQLHWYIKESAFICPEYIVEFEYVNSKIGPSENLEDKIYKFTLCTAEKIIQLDKREEWSDQCVRDLFKQGINLNTTCTELDLSKERLGCLEGIGMFKGLIRLVISHNMIESLKGLSSITALQELDASHNQLSTLQSIEDIFSLNNLNINFNQMTNPYNELLNLKQHTPNLTHLNFSFNPWIKAGKLRSTAINFLHGLEFLDEERIKKSERFDKTMQSKVYCFCGLAKGLDLTGWNCNGCEGNNDDVDNVTCVRITNDTLIHLDDFNQFHKLRRMLLENNNIVCIKDLIMNQATLVELSLSNNHLVDISCISALVNLEYLNLDYNNIEYLQHSVFRSLTRLQVLSVMNNNIDSLEGLTTVTSLVELYVSNNNVTNLREIFFLKKMNYLAIVDLHGNPINREEGYYRLFTIYHLRSMKILDGIFIESIELISAKEMFGGLLTKDFLADQLNTIDFPTIKVLDFPHFSLQTIDLGDPSLFSNLISINLEHNSLSSFCGLTHLNNLKTLCLNYNHIEGLFSRMKNRKLTSFGAALHSYDDDAHKDNVLQNLEVLHLGYNGIRDLSALHLHLFPSLRALFLQGNEITLMSGLEGCSKLEELVLDRNRMRFINETSFSQLNNLSELHLEENRLRSLSNFACLITLRRLFLGMNHLQEICEIEKLSPLLKLTEISLHQNNLSKRNTHKLILLHRLPGLQVIDGSPVNDNDRARAEAYFFEQSQFNHVSAFHNECSSNSVAAGLGHSKQSKQINNHFLETSNHPEDNPNQNLNE